MFLLQISVLEWLYMHLNRIEYNFFLGIAPKCDQSTRLCDWKGSRPFFSNWIRPCRICVSRMLHFPLLWMSASHYHHGKQSRENKYYITYSTAMTFEDLLSHLYFQVRLNSYGTHIFIAKRILKKFIPQK